MPPWKSDSFRFAAIRELGRWALLHWPRTFDQDVHESPGAILPVGAGGYVGDANQRAKQVEWLEVFAYVAAVHGSLHKRINRSPNLKAGRIVQPRRTADDAIQRRCDDLLCGN